MSEVTDGLTPATPGDLADALAFALRFDGRRRKHDAAEMMAQIVAKRLVEHLERSGFVVLKKPPIGGSAPPRPARSSGPTVLRSRPLRAHFLPGEPYQ
jgi:hypothetical protein